MEAVLRLLQPLRTKIANLFVKALVDYVDDSHTMQLVKIKFGTSDVRTDIEHVQEYGFYSHAPHKDSESFGACINGDRSHIYAIVVGNTRKRLKDLNQFEVAISNRGTEDYILLSNQGTINVKTDKLQCTGHVADSVGTLDELRKRFESLVNHYNKHFHGGNGASPTSPPFEG